MSASTSLLIERGRGFCIQGCKVGAKASTLVKHVPDALEHGAKIRDNCMGARTSLGKSGRTDGVFYFDAQGTERFQKACVLIVSGYALESPRLLFNSACSGHDAFAYCSPNLHVLPRSVQPTLRLTDRCEIKSTHESIKRSKCISL